MSTAFKIIDMTDCWTVIGNFFFEYPGDAHKFIHCDVWGHPWVTDCPSGEVWAQDLLTCYVPANYNPCLHHKAGDPYLYPHECDPHKFIHCDDNHQSFVQSCQLDYKFYEAGRTCVPPGQYGTDSLIYTCNGATPPPYSAQSYTPTSYRMTGAHSLNPSIQGYDYDPNNNNVEPCTMDNVRVNLLYFPYKYDNQHYIQCDLNGHQYLQSCEPYFFDPYSLTCVDGPVFVDNLLGRK